MIFNVYTEAKEHFEELLNNYEGTNKASVTFSELVEDNDYRIEYTYSVYNSALFAAISDDLNLLGYCEDVEQEFGGGIATNPLWINEAIFRYMMGEYEGCIASDFDIEAEDEEEDEE